MSHETHPCEQPYDVVERVVARTYIYIYIYIFWSSLSILPWPFSMGHSSVHRIIPFLCVSVYVCVRVFVSVCVLVFEFVFVCVGEFVM